MVQKKDAPEGTSFFYVGLLCSIRVVDLQQQVLYQLRCLQIS